MAVVVFDVDEFRQLYPQFSGETDAQLDNFFNVACLILDNSDASAVRDAGERKILLYMLVCHFASLYERGDGAVGSLTGASEGSVSASYSTANTGNAGWFAQTQCGATFWDLTKKYRLGGRYYAYRKC
jgi:hypothetical protein